MNFGDTLLAPNSSQQFPLPKLLLNNNDLLLKIVVSNSSLGILILDDFLLKGCLAKAS
jgi:hypothetical protein